MSDPPAAAAAAAAPTYLLVVSHARNAYAASPRRRAAEPPTHIATPTRALNDAILYQRDDPMLRCSEETRSLLYL